MQLYFINIFHGSSTTFQGLFNLLLVITSSNLHCCGRESHRKLTRKNYSSLFLSSDRFNAMFSQPFALCITIDSSLSTNRKEKWNYYVFVYNSLLVIHSLFQGDKRTQVSSSSEKGDV